MNKKISDFEAFCIFMMFSINSILLNTPKLLISSNETGAFINSIYIGFISLIFIIIINKMLLKFQASDIIDIAGFLGGKKLKAITGILFIFIFLIIICIYLSQFVILLKTVYFKNSPLLFILLFFLLGILICNLNGFTAVKNSLCFYFPICIFTLLYILLNCISGFSIIKITPIFGNSINLTFFSGISNIFVFTNIIPTFFIIPYMNNKKNFTKITVISFLFSWILVIISVLALLTSFPLDNTITELNPIYSLSRKIEITEFIQRADGFFVTIGIFSCLAYVTFLFYLITNIIKKIFSIENEKIISFPIISLIFGITYILITSGLYKNSAPHKDIFNFTIYFLSTLLLFLSLFKKKLM